MKKSSYFIALSTIEIKVRDKGAISLRAPDVVDSEEEFVEVDTEILIE